MEWYRHGQIQAKIHAKIQSINRKRRAQRHSEAADTKQRSFQQNNPTILPTNKKMIIPSPRSAAPARLVLVGCVLCLLRLLPATSTTAEEVCLVSPDSVRIGHCGVVNDTTSSYFTARFTIPPAGGKCVYDWEIWEETEFGYFTSTSSPWVLDASNLTQPTDPFTLVDPNCTDSCEVIVHSPLGFTNIEPVSHTIQHRFHAYYIRDGEELRPFSSFDNDWPFPPLSEDERDKLPSWTLTVTEDSCTYMSNSGRVHASGVLAAVICLIVVALQTTL
jgi:hypothetical protein